MPDVMTGISGAGLAMSVFGGSEAESSAGAAMGQQGAALQAVSETLDQGSKLWRTRYGPYEKRRSGMQRRMLPDYRQAAKAGLRAITKDRRRYEKGYYPLENMLLEEAKMDSGERLERAAGIATAGIDKQFDIAEKDLERSRFTRGIGPEGNAGGEREMAIARAGARANAANAARDAERSRIFAERNTLFQGARGHTPGVVGLPALNPAASYGVVASGGLGVASGYGGIAGGYMDQANMYGAGAGQFAGSLLDRYGSTWTNPGGIATQPSGSVNVIQGVGSGPGIGGI